MLKFKINRKSKIEKFQRVDQSIFKKRNFATFVQNDNKNDKNFSKIDSFANVEINKFNVQINSKFDTFDDASIDRFLKNKILQLHFMQYH